MQNSRATPPVVVASDLHKSFGGQVVLKGFEFTADRGSRHVLCGQNGSGKTTLVKILSTLVEPDHGQVKICGHAVPEELKQGRSHVSTYLFSNRGLWPQLNVIENLRLHARLFATKSAHWDDRLRTLQPLLNPFFNLYPQQLSLGMRQLVLIGRALLRDVPLYILDEPFAVLDNKNSSNLVAILEALTSSGRVVLLTAQTHSLNHLPASFARTEMRTPE